MKSTSKKNLEQENKAEISKEAIDILKQTVEDMRGIIDGKYDQLTPEQIMFIGSLTDIKQ